MPNFHRHQLTMLTFTLIGLITIGCSSKTPPTTPPTDTRDRDRPVTANTPTTVLPSETPEPDEAPTQPSRADLDLREANVLDVAFERLGDGSYRFDVTLLHDDDGEAPSYADSWQVEDSAGNVLGERILTHSHGTQAFTRSATIEVPEGVESVFVRGHDMEHGYGGQSMEVDLETGSLRSYIE